MVALDDQIYGCLRLAGDRAKDSKKRYETAIYSYHGRSWSGNCNKAPTQPVRKKSRPKGRLFFWLQIRV
jgi:hypothetical protein